MRDQARWLSYGICGTCRGCSLLACLLCEMLIKRVVPQSQSLPFLVSVCFGKGVMLICVPHRSPCMVFGEIHLRWRARTSHVQDVYASFGPSTDKTCATMARSVRTVMIDLSCAVPFSHCQLSYFLKQERLFPSL